MKAGLCEHAGTVSPLLEDVPAPQRATPTADGFDACR